MRRGTITMILTLVVVAGLAAAALAQPGREARAPLGGDDHWCGERAECGELMLGHLSEALELTEEQKTAIEALHEKARTERTQLRKEIARTRNELQGELLEDSPNEGKVVELTERIGELRTKLQVIRVKTRLAVHAQLTEEQRDELLLMRPHHGRPGRHGAQGHGPCRAPEPQAETR